MKMVLFIIFLIGTGLQAWGSILLPTPKLLGCSQEEQMKLIDCSTKKYPDKFAMVDDADFDWLNQWKWYAHKNRLGHSFYAITSRRKENIGQSLKMHRLILGINDLRVCDHIDGNGLNNQRKNIRICNESENKCNREKISSACTSKFKGVYFDAYHKKMRASITKNKKTIHLGYFKSELSAAIAYNKAAKILHGEFAKINSIRRVAE